MLYRGQKLSKLDKFIDQPAWFFKDAFKKRAVKISHKVEGVNKYLREIGVPLQLDLSIVEEKFVNTALLVSHNNKIGQNLVWLINEERRYKEEQPYMRLNKLAQVKRRFNYIVNLTSDKAPLKVLNISDKSSGNHIDLLPPDAQVIYLQLKSKMLMDGNK